MSMARLTATAVVLGYLTGAACSSTDSSFVATGRIVATITASAEGTGLTKDTGFEIGFDRNASGHVSADDSSVTLPTLFVLDGVADPVAMTSAPNPFSRSSSTLHFVIWDPFSAPDLEPGDPLHYEVTESCIEAFTGTIDSACPGGSFVGEQVRVSNLQSTA
jgi:hypothetical protein